MKIRKHEKALLSAIVFAGITDIQASDLIIAYCTETLQKTYDIDDRTTYLKGQLPRFRFYITGKYTL